MTQPPPPLPLETPAPPPPHRSGTSPTAIILTCVGIVVVVGGVLLIGALLAARAKAKDFVRRAEMQYTIENLSVALEAYKTEFGVYPPGGVDADEDGDLDDPGDDLGSGTDYSGNDATKLQLRAICTTLEIHDEQGEVIRTTGPFYSPSKVNIMNGRLVDIWGNPLRYLADGRRVTMDPANPGERMPGRVAERTFTLWSVGKDGSQDPLNNNLDDNANGMVDEEDELEDDICSWH